MTRGAAGATAAALGLQHETVPVTGAESPPSLPAIAAAMDQPTGDGVNSWVVSRARTRRGWSSRCPASAGTSSSADIRRSGSCPESRRRVSPAHRAGARSAARWRDVSRRPRVRRFLRGVMAARASAMPTVPSEACSACEIWSGLGRFAGSARGCHRSVHARRHHRTSTRRRGGAPGVAEVSAEPAAPGHRRDVDGALVGGAGAAARRRRCANGFSMPAHHPQSAGEAVLQAAAGFPTAPKRGFTLPFDMDAWSPPGARARTGAVRRSAVHMAVDREAREGSGQAFEAGRVHWSRPWTIAILRLWADTTATAGDLVRILMTVPSLGT